MNAILHPGPVLLAFLLASLVLAATPGPGVLYIVTRTLAQGRRAGLTSVAGVALGNLGNALGASLGLAALFAMSSWAFTVVKLAGAAYLLYLGFKALQPGSAGPNGEPLPAPALGRMFRDGFFVALLNPKTALFFAAFLPQFTDPAAPVLAQSVALGAVFVLIAACTDSAYVLVAAWAAPRLGGFQRGALVGRYASAAVYTGLGLFTVFSGGRAAK